MKKRYFLITAYVIASVVLSSCVTPRPSYTSLPSQSSKVVPPGFLYKGNYINVRAPNSDGWQLVTSSPSGMEFARSGSSPNESFGAQVLMFALPETKSEAEFVALIKQGFEKDTSPDRFEIVEADFKYIEQRGYPCVSVRSLVRDKMAHTPSSNREVLLLQAESLYCRHPERQDTGFSIIYSHRGSSLFSNLSAEAQDFINGVQVPGH